MLYRQCLLDDHFLSETQWIEDLIDTVKKISCHISKLSSVSQSTEICASGKTSLWPIKLLVQTSHLWESVEGWF